MVGSRDIFERRVNIKPVEYPEFEAYKLAIRASYWVHDEFNFTADIQDFHTKLNDNERLVVKRTMLAISQIEVQVKRFWADLSKYFPKPELDDVGVTFADSEVRHKDAYSELLEILGLNEEFERISEIPAIADRISYLDKINLSLKDFQNTKDKNKVVFAVIIFALFVEHISLFGQFLIMLSFNKEQNTLKDLANVVQATSKEEEIHGKFGLELFKIIKEEHPEFINEELLADIHNLCLKAVAAETKILDWIFEGGDLDHLSKQTVQNYINSRFNSALKTLGIKYEVAEILPEELEKIKWFDELMMATPLDDFFYKKSQQYNKKTKSITEDDLF